MLYKKGFTELSVLLSEKKVSAKEIAEIYIKRIEDIDKTINAYISFDGERLLKEAELSDQRRSKGEELSQFDGIPVAIKDNICTVDIKTTCASKMLGNFIPPYNAAVYDKLLAKGMIALGKTNLDEFSMGSSTESSIFGATKNPYDTNRVSGGSSGGSAAAVSAFMAPVSIGTDTGGSIRQPAAFCGVTGIKPTCGRVSRHGIIGFASSLDQVGTFGRNVQDAAALLKIISGYDKKDSVSINREVDIDARDITKNIKGLKIGLPEEYFRDIDSETGKLIEQRIDDLKKSGAELKSINLKYTQYASPVSYIIGAAEASSNLAKFDGVGYGFRTGNVNDLTSLYVKTRSEGFGDEVKRRIILGTYTLSSGHYDEYYLKALKSRTLIINDFKNVFNQVDAIITPVTLSPAFKLGEKNGDPLQMYMSDNLTISANLTGIPALSTPAGLNKEGLPIGIQIMGNYFDEQKIINISAVLEEICGEISPSL
ncbi:MAG: Asp-tRNA(Asn)/Glu-tRNA(Gln) amidotransferase subunit GatA [Leptospirales bacterium]|nr:Asp-tRNA(Asn)/Glu-tRNA(Gln) amidotransferase subunit GatA [Leptospirales bacterium]